MIRKRDAEKFCSGNLSISVKMFTVIHQPTHNCSCVIELFFNLIKKLSRLETILPKISTNHFYDCFCCTQSSDGLCLFTVTRITHIIRTIRGSIPEVIPTLIPTRMTSVRARWARQIAPWRPSWRTSRPTFPCTTRWKHVRWSYSNRSARRKSASRYSNSSRTSSTHCV